VQGFEHEPHRSPRVSACEAVSARDLMFGLRPRAWTPGLSSARTVRCPLRIRMLLLRRKLAELVRRVAAVPTYFAAG